MRPMRANRAASDAEVGVSSIDDGLRWVALRVQEVVDGAPIDGVQIRRRDGERSWPVHAMVRWTESASTTEERVRAELVGLVEEATESGRALHLRLVALRGGVAAASRAVYVPAPERASDAPSSEDAPRDASSALVATNRDLRALLEVYARGQGQQVAVAMQGWVQSKARVAELERELADHRAALQLAESAQEGNPALNQAMQALAPMVPGILASIQARSQRSEELAPVHADERG